MDIMAKTLKHRAKKEVFDFHFVVDKKSAAADFVAEADLIGRNYTEHFKRILNERYNPKESDHD